MAGDWIKMRGNLWDDPRVASLVDATDTSEAAVVGGLYWLWATADQHTENGVMPGLTLRQIDRKTGIPGFGAALVAIGWLGDHPEGVRLINFTEHNGASAKRRASDAQRKANDRNVSASDADKTRTEPGQDAPNLGAREEKSREEKKEETGEGSTSRKRSTPPGMDCPADVAEQVWADWVKHRKGKRATVSVTVVEEARAEAEKAGLTLERFLKVWCSRGSQGLEADWLKPHERGSPQQSTETSYQKSMRERVAEFAPSLARQAPNATNVIDMEIFDVTSIARN